ncbi:MAG: response regulator [Oscillospiraceae bacterium]|nr:response regulator [Oscillospiraceae bacterium]
MKKKLFIFSNIIIISIILITVGAGYYKFTSHLIFKDSASHLEEVFSQSNQSLKQLVGKKWACMKDWANYFKDSQSDYKTDEYINHLKENNGFIEFYFLSQEGEYITTDGKTGYINLGENLTKLMIDKENIALKAAFHGQDEFELFGIPCYPGEYKDFKYEAFAISLDNDRLIETLENKVYNEDASTYVIHSDGRVWLDNVGQNKRSVYNFLGMIKEHSDLSEHEIETIREDIDNKKNGVMTFEMDKEKFYLVYQPVNFDDWTLIGLVPQKVVNQNMTKLQILTLFVGIGSVSLIMFTIGFIMVHKSRSRLKRMGTEIKYREKLFTALSDNVDDVFIVIDKDSMKVSYVSENIDTILGISEDDVINDMHIIEKTADSDYDMDIIGKLNDLKTGKRIELEQCCYINHNTNEKVWFTITVLCADVESVIRYIVVMSNRTKEVKAKLELQNALGNAQAANKAKSTFLSNISHDIRTPMNAIIGFSVLAASDIDDQIKVRDYLEKINLSGKHLLSLINDVLDMSMIESGKVHLEENEVCLSDVINDIRTIVSGQIRDKNLSFDINTDGLYDDHVICDKVHLEQVILNILINAIKFTPLGGKVSLSVSQESVSQNNTSVYIFKVKDTGIGMSAEFAKKIFEPFEREQTSTVSGIEGSGLGMAIAKNIIDLMNGTVKVVTESGKGTEFIISLKFKVQKKSPQKPKPKKNLDLKSTQKIFEGKRVLLVEDNELNREIAENILKKFGFCVETANDGSEAVEKVKLSEKDIYDIILMDVHMPVMDGHEATKQIRCLENKTLAYTPIVAMTANAFKEDKLAAEKCGMNGFISKPINIDNLISSLRKVFETQ